MTDDHADHCQITAWVYLAGRWQKRTTCLDCNKTLMLEVTKQQYGEPYAGKRYGRV